MTSRPTGVEPTKVMPWMSEWSSIPFTTVRPPWTMFQTPGGNPASSASSMRKAWLFGTSLEGLTTTVLPVASA